MNGPRELKSMTGYGQGEITSGSFKLRISLKSLNGKYFDLDVRMSRNFAAFEPELRQRLREQLERGSVSASVSMEYLPGTEHGSRVTTDIPLAEAYAAQMKLLAHQLNTEVHDLLGKVMAMPDVLRVNEVANEEQLRIAFFQALDLSIQHMESFRKQEGQRIGEILRSALHHIREGLKLVEQEEQARRELLRKRLWSALETQEAEGKMDRNRFEQEVILYVEKLDITEEKNRLAQHLDYFETCLLREPSGKKLNFIAQEIGRELNTMGVKSNHFPMQQAVVDMKEQLEQIREQVLNLL
jgi:uncharacterized protein (TIGR00255 family)